MSSSARNSSKKVYSFLGPVGTFTELALAQVKAAKGAVHKPVSSVTEAIDDVLSGVATRAIVPVENSIEGGVSATLDALANSSEIRIFGEYLVPVTFNLVARPGTKLADVHTVATHPVAYAQCRGWLAAKAPARTGRDKTSVIVELPSDRPGALLEMLEQFAARGVNLSRIESRPIGDRLGRYRFNIDVQGHVDDSAVAEALMGLHRFSPRVVYLGSYPRADKQKSQHEGNNSNPEFTSAADWLKSIRNPK